MISQALNAFFLWRKITFQYFCSSITTAGAKTISIWLVLWLEGTNPPGGETRNPQLRQDYRIIPSMSQNCLKFWDKFETKLRTDLRPYRDNLETYLTILLLRANWDIFETWVHSVMGIILDEIICESSNWQHIKKLRITILGTNWQLFRLERIAKCSDLFCLHKISSFTEL